MATDHGRFGFRCKLTPAEQDRVLDLHYSLGLDHMQIARVTKLNHTSIEPVIKRGTVMPLNVAPYRCGECGNKVEVSPCFVCRAKYDAEQGRGAMQIARAS